MIEIKNLSKSYKDKLVLQDINLKIPATGITALVGDNGVGKTTLINSILGYIKRSSGEIFINGKLDKDNKEDCMKIFFMPDLMELNLAMTIRDYVAYLAVLKKEDIKKVLKKFDDAVIKLNLDFITKKKKMNELSAGQKKKVFLAIFFSLEIKFIILDEPTANLDVRTKNEFIDILNILKKNNIGILITSHIIEELQQIADYLIVINDKKVVYDSPFNKDLEKISTIYEQKVARKHITVSEVEGLLEK